MTLHEYEELGPGLHRVGPNPWDFVFNPAKGLRITSVGLDGVSRTDTIKDFTRDKKTGEISMTMDGELF